MNLFLFDSLMDDPVVSALLAFRETGAEDAYYQAARGLIGYGKHRLTSGNIIKEYILHTMLESPNMHDITDLRDFLRQDIKLIFHQLLEEDWDGIFREKGLLPLSGMPMKPQDGQENAGYVRSLEMMMECSSNEALVGALLAHEEEF